MMSEEVKPSVEYKEAALLSEKHILQGGDEAAEYDVEEDFSPEETKKLTHRSDWIIIPLIGVCYVFFYVDKTSLSYASLFGVKEDLNLEATDYNWLLAIFYFGYLAFCFVNNYFLIRLPVGKYLGFNIFMWGALLMIQAACTSFAGLLVVRFFGGAFESVADPSYMLITAMWYTRREQPIRIGAWYTFNGVGIAFGGLVGYGIGQIKYKIKDSDTGSWRWEFIIIGAACCVWGLIVTCLMPDSPMKARFLNDHEKKVIIHKLKANQTGIETRVLKWYQVREAFMDPKLYLLSFTCLFANVPNGVVSNFGTLIVRGLGYSGVMSSVLQIPYGVYISACILTCVFLNDYFIIKLRKNLRVVFALLFILPNIAGSFGLYFVDQKHHVGKLICYYLTGTYNASFVMILSLSTSNIAGHTKKIVFNALIFLGYCVGNIAGPFMAKSNQASRGYPLASGAMFFSNFMECFLIIVFALYCKWENRKRDQEQAVTGDRQQHAFDDLTDGENRSFRYVY